MVVSCVTEGLLVGKLDQNNKLLYVQSTYGRDVKNEDQINDLIATLEAWDKNLMAASGLLDTNVIAECKQNIVNNTEMYK